MIGDKGSSQSRLLYVKINPNILKQQIKCLERTNSFHLVHATNTDLKAASFFRWKFHRNVSITFSRKIHFGLRRKGVSGDIRNDPPCSCACDSGHSNNPRLSVYSSHKNVPQLSSMCCSGPACPADWPGISWLQYNHEDINIPLFLKMSK